jgi:hypothetical protein
MSRHQKKTGRDMFSYFIEFCGLEGFEHRWSAIDHRAKLAPRSWISMRNTTKKFQRVLCAETSWGAPSTALRIA